jgi:hypothetical protein
MTVADDTVSAAAINNDFFTSYIPPNACMKPEAVEELLWLAKEDVAKLAPELPFAVAVEPKFIPEF